MTGEAGIRMTLAAFGELVDLSVEESDDGLTCSVRLALTEHLTLKTASPARRATATTPHPHMAWCALAGPHLAWAGR